MRDFSAKRCFRRGVGGSPYGVVVGDALWATATAVCGSLVAIWVFKLWKMSPRVPLAYGGDGNLAIAGLTNLDARYWYFQTSRLGAPFGQDLRDYPAAGDLANLFYAKFLGFFTDDIALLVNFFFLSSYSIVAAAAFIASRIVGLRRPVSLMAGVIYTALPYHLYRGEAHLFLANFAVVPLAMALVLRQAGPRPMLRRRDGARLGGYGHRDSLIGALIVLLAGTSGFYYAAYTCGFLALATVLAAVRGHGRAAVISVVAVITIAFLVVLQLLPTILYQRSAGANPIAERTFRDVELYPLRPAFMLLPTPGHRAGFIREWRDGVPSPIITSESFGEVLGTFGTIGFALCTMLLILRFSGRRPRWSRRFDDAPLYLILGVIFSTYAGLALVLGAAGFTQLRALNRISIFLAFLCILATASAIDSLVRHRRRTALLLLPVITVVAVWDQTPVWSAPDYEATAQRWANDNAFFASIEETLDPGAAVFQLPIAEFPESPPIVAMLDYSQLAGYLHSDKLRWSYGGLKGRSADWRYRLDLDGPGLVDDLLLTGFTGLTVNTNGYADGGASIAQMLSEVGISPTLVNANGDVVFYDLRPAQSNFASMSDDERAERRQELLEQPDVRYGSGFYDAENPGGRPFRWVQPTSSLTLQGPVPDIGPAQLRLRVSTYTPGTWSLVVTTGGTAQQFEVSDVPRDVDVRVTLDGDSVVVDLTSDAPVDTSADTRELSLNLEGLPTVIFEDED